ncbi:MAG: hypothetical protein ACREEP_03440, partial [Dongiaceae bacterium]
VGLTNNIVRNTYHFGDLMKSHALKVQGGRNCIFSTLLRKNAVHGFVAPYDVREVRETQGYVEGNNPWSFHEGSWSIEDLEDHLNDGDQSKIFDLAEAKEEQSITESAEELEETWWDPVGAADRLGSTRPPFPGVKYHVTRNGYHVDGTPTVSGINAKSDVRFSNRYIGPLGSNLNKGFTHDTTDTLTSGNQIREKMRKAIRYCRFMSPNGANLADDDKKLAVNMQKIYADEIAYDAIQKTGDALGHGNESIAPKELERPAPIFMGVPVDWVEDLGVGTGGLPSYVRSSGSAETDRGVFSAGQYPSTGEVFMLNLRNLRVIGKEGVFPLIKPPVYIPQQQAMFRLIRHCLSTVCTMRQRQVAMWGFSPLIAA